MNNFYTLSLLKVGKELLSFRRGTCLQELRQLEMHTTDHFYLDRYCPHKPDLISLKPEVGGKISLRFCRIKMSRFAVGWYQGLRSKVDDMRKAPNMTSSVRPRPFTNKNINLPDVTCLWIKYPPRSCWNMFRKLTQHSFVVLGVIACHPPDLSKHTNGGSWNMI